MRKEANEMLFPKELKIEDKVFLLCLSSAMNPDNVEKCVKKIEELGYIPILGESVKSNYGGYMAGSIETRLNDLHTAFSREDVKAIICMRGGFSSGQLLDKINYDLIRKNPKIFVGYSDVTNLHIVLNQKCNLGTYHGPMVESNMINDFNEYTKNDFLKAIKMKKWKYEEPENMPLKILKESSENKIEGIITGGNLSLIVTTLGTENEIDTRNKILFLEDISEEIGRLDRMLTHLKLAGKLEDCNGIILGNFDDCSNRYEPSYTFEKMIKDFFRDYNKCVIYDFESGHKKPNMATIPLGAKCCIDIEKKEIIFEKEVIE